MDIEIRNATKWSNRRKGILPISEYNSDHGQVDIYCIPDYLTEHEVFRPVRFPSCQQRGDGSGWGWIHFGLDGEPIWRYIDGRNSEGILDGIFPVWVPIAFKVPEKMTIDSDWKTTKEFL